MKMMKDLICFFLLSLAITPNSMGHHPVLPQPQQIVYGDGQFELKDVTIGFVGKSCEEDQYAAQELTQFISGAVNGKIRIRESGTAGASIIFERTGNADPLPLPGEKPGPGSRESYKIKVSSDKVIISSPSSAGLFYGVQTLRQLIGRSGEKAVIPEVEIADWPSLAYRGFMIDRKSVV